MASTEEKRKVKVSVYSKDSLTVSGLREDESENLRAAINYGAHWVTTEDGKLKIHPKYKELPNPTDDEMLPFWSPISKEDKKYVQEEIVFDGEAVENSFSPSIEIQHLCGYSYTPEGYKREAARLESYGFDCLRSRRDEGFEYCEIWRLPDLFFAKGDLKILIESLDRSAPDTLQTVIRFLTKKVLFGSLDVCVQRVAMVID